MKNLSKMLLCAIAAIAAFACTTDTPAGEGLQAPNFKLSVTDNTILVSWDAVAGAAYYEVSLDNGEPERTDKTVHRFEGLAYEKEYSVSLAAVSADEKSEVVTKTATIGARTVPAYREWYPLNNASATAISDNGRWVVGGSDHQGMIINLNTDELVLTENVELYDVANDGTAVGAYFVDSLDGEAAIYINGKVEKIDLSELTTSNMSCLTGITPDGEYIVGWWWENDEKSYYGSLFGMIVPFCYDVLKDSVTVPEAGQLPYEIYGLAACGVTPDRRIIGNAQSAGPMHIVMWDDEYTPYRSLCLEYNDDYTPALAFGDGNSRFSANGNYICGIAKTFEFGEAQQPAVYDCTTGEVIAMTGIGQATCVTDDGIAFLNDAPYYLGITSYVVDLKGDIETQTPIVDWLLDEHSVDLFNYIKEGVITIGASADGRTLLGITNTDQGWVSYVINLDGEAMPEL